MAYYTHRSWKPLQLYLGLMFCPHYSQSPSTLTNSTCWAGCCSSPAVQLTGSSEADFIFVNDQCVNVHLCLDLCSHRFLFFFVQFCLVGLSVLLISLVYGSCVMSSPDPDSCHFFALPPPSPCYRIIYQTQFLCYLCFCFQPFICTLSHLLHGERMALMNCMQQAMSIKNCWYVPLILHTYMQQVCLHYTVCVCCIHIYNILNKIFI